MTNHINVTTCYLVGGAPTSGKTTYAYVLAAQHQAVQLSTDNIRSWMKKLTKVDDYPNLFITEGITAEEFYAKYDTPESVVEQEIGEGKEVEKGIVALLQSKFPWERLVIEGIALTPSFVEKLIRDFPNINFIPTFLFDDNVERIEQRIHGRGLWGPKDSYPDYIKPLEVKWVIKYHEFFSSEATKLGFDILRIDDLINDDSLVE